GKVPTADLVNFNRQLADLVGSGIPLVKALSIILNQTREDMLRGIVADINKNVQAGDSLAQAMRKHPRVFSPLSVAMVRAGETGGMLDEVLQRLADFAENEQELKGKVVSSLAYPAIMVLAGMAVISVLILVVLPKISGVYSDMGQVLPGITRFMISITDIVGTYWWMVLIGLIAGIIAFQRFMKTAEGRRMFHTAILKIPVIGNVIQKRELALFARTLGNLLRNGVAILTALDITRDVITNTIMRQEVEKLTPSVSQGGNISRTLSDSPLFPATIVSMIAVGEETAQLDDILLKVADTCEREVDRSLKTLTSMLEPLIILGLGLIVGFIVISMMLPIMTLDPTGGAY
ncbi:MAG: type II secretion system F family protein, partial [Candidatus Sumerlaeota bacterium]